jgi:hypothetical protein
MNQPKKLEPVLDAIRLLLADRTRAPGDYALAQALWDLVPFRDQLSRNAPQTRAVLEVVRLLRASDGPGRQKAEERLIDNLQSLAWHCSGCLEDTKATRLPHLNALDQLPPEVRSTFEVLRELRDFALGCFEFKRPRDSFGGRRRALAFDILAEVGRWVDLPEAVSLARRALRKAQSVEARQAAEFLQRYFAARDLSPDEATTEQLLALAEQTDSRSTAFGALNALVETGKISEFQALDRLDDWKSRH